MGESHEVMVFCDCDDIESCSLELYISDVRIAFDEIIRLSDLLELVTDEAA
jgi:hypothetical protein